MLHGSQPTAGQGQFMELTRLKSGPCPVLLAWLIGLALCLPQVAGAGTPHPLEPVDTSSPRATLTGFLGEMDEIWTALRDRYWESPSKQAKTEIFGGAARVLRTLDLSGYAPSTRIEVGYDAGTFLYETLSRLELPPADEIPDAGFFESMEGPAGWTIPHTDITIVRIEEGPRRGEFLFSAATVTRANEFFRKTQALPYVRDVPMANTQQIRQVIPGWWLSPASIYQLPDWMRRVVLEQAVWKWVVLAALLPVIAGLIVLVYRLTRRGETRTPVGDYLHRLVLPLFVLVLIPPVSYLITEQINIISDPARTILLVMRATQYLLATWVAWLGALLLAELIILSPRIGEQSLHAQLLRLSARITGIMLGLVILFYGANQIGLPVVGVLAGVGVSGLAIALAAQDSLKNLLGSLMIFMDQPYTPGQRIIVQGHDGFVEHIGLRSTKIRMLNGSLTAIPNEKMANLDIENIGRRNFIRRQTSIRLSYDTPSEKIQQAIGIIRDILDNHEGMRPELPPRVFFDEFNPDSLNIRIFYWYHPPKRWQSLAFDERVNLEIMQRFGEAGIKLAPPTSRVSLESLDQGAAPGPVA
jgi:MscS family membrane protein